ncbi:MAG: hypothetical protein P0Y56_16715 [Candidatus Andeanibacterium colombiense]|uniref:Uncharacterized protein n=1 Tax=Candidatus Andeanibacterium colombiense TaxID=3121345 RepID=A0AAJ5X8P7_9SPHN|nr:MAG: hypothetical protein P0Y56_16715 [Sphingomonadaceae bacterium]
MRYFLDAEFNGFGGELISLALVPEKGGLPPFYEAIRCDVPTEWVAQNVIPVLETRPLAREEVARRFADYLGDDPDPHLVADWPEDISHAALLLITGPGRMYPIRSMRFELVDPNIFGFGVSAQFPHNAYHDALTLREAVLGYERRMA